MCEYTVTRPLQGGELRRHVQVIDVGRAEPVVPNDGEATMQSERLPPNVTGKTGRGAGRPGRGTVEQVARNFADKCARIRELLLAEPGLRVVEISQRLQFSKSEIYRVLRGPGFRSVQVAKGNVFPQGLWYAEEIAK